MEFIRKFSLLSQTYLAFLAKFRNFFLAKFILRNWAKMRLCTLLNLGKVPIEKTRICSIIYRSFVEERDFRTPTLISSRFTYKSWTIRIFPNDFETQLPTRVLPKIKLSIYFPGPGNLVFLRIYLFFLEKYFFTPRWVGRSSEPEPVLLR